MMASQTLAVFDDVIVCMEVGDTEQVLPVEFMTYPAGQEYVAVARVEAPEEQVLLVEFKVEPEGHE
jgi:hypothetical protein